MDTITEYKGQPITELSAEECLEALKQCAQELADLQQSNLRSLELTGQIIKANQKQSSPQPSLAAKTFPKPASDKFLLNYASKIWPAITDDTDVLLGFGVQKTEFTLMGLKGTEIINLVACTDAKCVKWGYGLIHNVLVVIEEDYPQPSGIAVWNNQMWGDLSESKSPPDNHPRNLVSYIATADFATYDTAQGLLGNGQVVPWVTTDQRTAWVTGFNDCLKTLKRLNNEPELLADMVEGEAE